MNLTRKYLQFNNLVIDNFDMLESADLSGGFKTETQEYSFGHGSYAPFKSEQQFSTEQSLSMTFNLNIKKLSCDQKEHYKDFITLNLIKPGRIWAIQGKQLLWSYAFVSEFGEVYSSSRDSFSIDVDMVLYEGVWHKADPKKVFFRPYDLCNYLDCEDFRTVGECEDCCTSCITPMNEPCPTCACECENLSEEYSLCAMKDEIAAEFYRNCSANYKIVYNCEAGKLIWGEKSMLGQKLCKNQICEGTVAGTFYSDTILSTENITITIEGIVNDPLLTVNGNTIKIAGEYNGRLTVMPNGEIYYLESECCEESLLDIETYQVQDGSTFGFTVHHGENSLILETNNCCSAVCVYVKVDSITI